MEPLIRDGRARKLSFTGSTEVGRDAARAGRGQGAADVDGARRQRPVPGVRRRRPRRRRRGRDDWPRCATWARPAPPPTASSCTARSPARSPTGSPSGWPRCGSAAAPTTACRWARWSTPRAGTRSSSSSATPSSAARPSGSAASAVDGPGWFYRPTVLTDVPLEARLTKEEIFGPVAPISVFDTDDEAVAAANDTEFGLVSYLFTENLTRALRVSERLESGMVGLNTGLVSNPAAPFGGHQAVRPRPRGRRGRHRGVPRDEVRRRRPEGRAETRPGQGPAAGRSGAADAGSRRRRRDRQPTRAPSGGAVAVGRGVGRRRASAGARRSASASPFSASSSACATSGCSTR